MSLLPEAVKRSWKMPSIQEATYPLSLSCEGAVRFFPFFGNSVRLEVGLLEVTEKVEVLHVGLGTL